MNVVRSTVAALAVVLVLPAAAQAHTVTPDVDCSVATLVYESTPGTMLSYEIVVNGVSAVKGSFTPSPVSGTLTVPYAAPAGTFTVTVNAQFSTGETGTVTKSMTCSTAPAPPAAAPPAVAPAPPTPPATAVPAEQQTPPAAAATRRPTPLLSPFPIVHIRGTLGAGWIQLQLLSVRAPRGARIALRCSGVSCPVRSVVVRVARTGATPVRFPMMEELPLRAGVVITIAVTKQGRIGKYTRFVLRRDAPPARRDMCMRYGATRPSACPVQ
jgi:hypothetical protein